MVGYGGTERVFVVIDANTARLIDSYDDEEEALEFAEKYSAKTGHKTVVADITP